MRPNKNLRRAQIYLLFLDGGPILLSMCTRKKEKEKEKHEEGTEITKKRGGGGIETEKKGRKTKQTRAQRAQAESRGQKVAVCYSSTISPMI